jgi:hypothetical protein
MALPYGMDDAKLVSIINATNNAVSQMQSLNTAVQHQAQDYILANDSDSGRVMQQALFRWNGEFNQIVADLNGLNDKVSGLRGHNNNILIHTVDTAKGARL